MNFFRASIKGEIFLQGAIIGEDLDCRGARLEAKNSKGFSPFLAPALTATAASVGGSVLFDDKRAEAFGLLDGFYLIGSMMTRQQIPQPNFSGRLSQHGFAGSSDRYTDR